MYSTKQKLKKSKKKRIFSFEGHSQQKTKEQKHQKLGMGNLKVAMKTPKINLK